MDPMTQSTQISSSQGIADGQNAAPKESKLSDSFLSSSPVSLIQSPQDKRVVLGSDKPCEGVATSLRFPSQPGSFTPVNYGSEAGPPDGQPDSPIKTSPVSERIKALEALAAKKKEPDFKSDGGFSHFRDRHQEKSPTETPKSPTETKKSPSVTPKYPTETPKFSTETPKFSTETPKFNTETPKFNTETPKFNTETPKFNTEIPKFSTETTKSPTETPKSPTEKITPTVQQRGGSADQESPESPFEVLGELRKVNEFEETEEWMKAHLPPVPDFDVVDLIKGTLTSDNVTSKDKKEIDIVIHDAPATFAGVPDAFMDSPAEVPKLKEEFNDAQKQPSVEEESEFDLSFLPTAHMWDQQDKSTLDSVPASPAPPAAFDSPSPPVSPLVGKDAKQNVSDDKKTTWTGDLEAPEASEADSSGESDDTVIEDGITVSASVPPPSSDQAFSAAPNLPTEEKETPPKSERKLMQVPTINVIETDEPNYSEEEMEMEMEMELEAEEDEDFGAVKDLAREAPKTPEPELEVSKYEPPKTRPLETEFIEGYSPPSSPVDSDAEYSPKHNILKSLPETVQQESASKPEALPNQAHTDKSQTTFNKGNDEPYPFTVTNKEVDFLDNDDEWSDEAQDILVKPCKTDLAFMETTNCTKSKVDEKNTAAKEAHMEMASLSKTSFMQDDIYDRQSFDYDYDASSPLDDIDEKGLNNAKEQFLSDPSQINDEPRNASSQILDNFTSVNDDEAFPKPVGQPCLRDYPQDPYSSFQSETQSNINEQEFNKTMTTDSVTDNMANGNSLPAQKIGSKIQPDTRASQHAPETTSNPENIDSDSSISEPTDSFVEFMRECLKSRQDEEPDDTHQTVPSKNKLGKTGLPPSQSPPTMLMDLEQERLTITALKELGSSQEEEEELAYLQSKVPDQGKTNPNVTSIQQSSLTSVPNPPCSQSNRVFDGTYSKEVEAIDEWVAEAYHLAEHVLTAILTHLSVKDLIHWRDPKKSGLVFGLSMLMLLSLAAFSVISVASYLLLALLCVTITFRIYKSVVQAVQKSSDGHPFKTLIDKDVSIPPETFRKHVDASLTYINRALKQMSRLFLVEDLVDSLKLAVVMWLFTYVGAVFNGITILILADILLFAVPPVYEKNKTQVDQYIDVIRTQVNTTMAKLQEKLPGAVKRSKTE
ncbi:reticulon-3 isoform X3 [Cottoperca gobio]|uniref:Reticulon n=1 Tax=Cottoperca gobio TaxID=56716 RepID=A0A6J2RHM3_COTGO|nr:reticulon-1-like isoform X3 [Cottoperca gobio]